MSHFMIPRWGFVLILIALMSGCSASAAKGQLSGKVYFKGKLVPAGYISFMPDSSAGNQGPVKVAQIKNGEYSTADGPDPGIVPGATIIRIAGFDGKPFPKFGQGKQIFNPYESRETLPTGTTTRDFTVPDSAADNLKFEPTSDF